MFTSGLVVFFFLALKYLIAHQLSFTYDLSDIGLWSDTGTGSFFIALKKIQTDETMLFGTDGTIRPASECNEAVKVQIASPLVPENIEAVLNILKPHHDSLNWKSFLPTLTTMDTAEVQLLPFEFWSSIGPLNCLQILLRLSEPSSIIDMIHHIESIGVNTDKFCLKASRDGIAEGPPGESHRLPNHNLFSIIHEGQLYLHSPQQSFFLHTKLFTDDELVTKGQPLYLYHIA